jgi:hypothetical protein
MSVLIIKFYVMHNIKTYIVMKVSLLKNGNKLLTVQQLNEEIQTDDMATPMYIVSNEKEYISVDSTNIKVGMKITVSPN